MVTFATTPKSWNNPIASVWAKETKMVLCRMASGRMSPLVVTPLM